MRKVIYLPLIAFLFLLCADKAFSQTAAVDTIGDKLLKAEKKASIKFGVNYLSNSVYLGRADTVKTPIIEPSIKYTFKNGIYVSGNLEYIPNRITNRLDAGSVAAGYEFDITEDLNGGASFTKMFYNATSTQIGSSIGSTINVNLDYDIADIITPSVSIDYNLLKQGFGSDIMINAGIAHDFAWEGIFGDKDILIISPTATLNAGTQNFYDAYFTLKKYKLTKKAQAKDAAAEKLIRKRDAQLSQFEMLDYEFSVPIEYKAGPVIFSLTPTYALAENALPPRIANGLVNSSGLFYVEAGVSVKF
ncbi:MAG: hypothetical protein ACHQHN_08385 [Sphingobacteriales bacterium]